MSGLNPTGPSQPGPGTVYSTPGNPASKEPSEQARSQQQSKDDAPSIAHRNPSQQISSDDATPSSLGRGVRGSGPGEDSRELSDQDQGLTKDVDADALATYGEGETATAVKNKSGAGGGEPGLETDLDRKKAEQAPAREAQKQEEKREVDVAGVLGQRGGPANPVDKDGYPNKGS